MSDPVSHESNSNRLLSFSLRRPVLAMLILFFLACIVKFIDSFVLRLDELLGEAILTKAAGFLLVAGYVWASGRRLRDIGLHTRNLGKALLIGGLSFGGLYALAYAAQMILLSATGQEPSLILSAVDPKTGMSGGLLFGIWLLSANLVNSAMEDGLFRGAMIRHFLLRFSGWGAILLQAGLFAVWHLSWPARSLLDGDATLSQAGFEALSLLVATFIAGIAYGYVYLKTDSLWSPFVAHAINNGIFNVLFIKTRIGVQAGQESGLLIGIVLLGYLLLIPAFRVVCRRLGMPEVQRWGETSLE